MENGKKKFTLSASILAADFSKLSHEIKFAQKEGCGEIHFDVMDGHFVSQISMGPIVLEPLLKFIQVPIEIHLMVQFPTKFISSFAQLRCDAITFHVECGDKIDDVIEQIKENGMKVGIAINPDTPLEQIHQYLSLVDRVLIMTVDPGFSGQKFKQTSLMRIKEMDWCLREKKIRDGVDLCVDGGINFQTILDCKNAGANLFVTGSSIFASKRVENNVSSLLKTIR